MAQKTFRKGEIGRLYGLADGTGADPEPVKTDLRDGIKPEPFPAGQRINLRRSRIQAMPATEIRADGHVPHADSFYQNIKEYTACYFTEIGGKVNQENEIKAGFRKALEAEIQGRHVPRILKRLFREAGRPGKGHDPARKSVIPRGAEDGVKKRLVAAMGTVEAAYRQCCAVLSPAQRVKKGAGFRGFQEVPSDYFHAGPPATNAYRGTPANQ